MPPSRRGPLPGASSLPSSARVKPMKKPTDGHAAPSKSRPGPDDSGKEPELSRVVVRFQAAMDAGIRRRAAEEPDPLPKTLFDLKTVG